MSFIDLMANDVWSSSDIDNKVQSLIRSRYNQQDELKASRLARTTNATLADMAFVAEVDAWIAACVQQGRDAYMGMKLLAEVLDMLTANARLLQPESTPVYNDDLEVVNQAEITEDTLQRQQAKETLDTASAEAKALFEIRKPVVVEPEVADPVTEITESVE